MLAAFWLESGDVWVTFLHWLIADILNTGPWMYIGFGCVKKGMLGSHILEDITFGIES